ncbi:hypothetical protein Tco_1056964 [Tanacetum coccineum]|uniref:Uncharacterized protein n=1 Tax=Tanacetum coccineum TaxID=301880 RepID=A0ABQ5H417_9ASTR
MNNSVTIAYRFEITLQLCFFDGSKPKNNDELQPRLSNFFKNFDSNGGDDLCYQDITMNKNEEKAVKSVRAVKPDTTDQSIPSFVAPSEVDVAKTSPHIHLLTSDQAVVISSSDLKANHSIHQHVEIMTENQMYNKLVKLLEDIMDDMIRKAGNKLDPWLDSWECLAIAPSTEIRQSSKAAERWSNFDVIGSMRSVFGFDSIPSTNAQSNKFCKFVKVVDEEMCGKTVKDDAWNFLLKMVVDFLNCDAMNM